MNAALALDGLSCVRGGRLLFENLSLSLPAGRLLWVRGNNGAGKTSLLRMLCGLLSPTSGQILWRGQSLASQRAALGQDRLYLGHAAALKDDLSCLENLRTSCLLAGRAVSPSAALQALADAGVAGHEHLPARQLSQGQRRRSALARLALAAGAPLWILDEPFNALDLAAVAWLEALLRGQLLRGGTVVLTSHQDALLPGLAQEVLAL
jgi:heme exporter protein A